MRRMISKFLKDENAAVAFEAIIITPVLAWLFVGSFVFFDAFRAYNSSVKATFAVADVLSRQTELVYGSDIEGLADIFQHITRNVDESAMRVTQVQLTQFGLRVDWSYATDGRARLFNSSLPGIADRIPIMAQGSHILIVESFLPYRPVFNVGLGELEFENFTVTRPRFADFVNFDDGTNPLYCPTGCDVGEGTGGDPGGNTDPPIDPGA